ncbi:MAG: helix-hairpin-helix domain-containing protein [Proteobacteria bacterium]|nr:helix-hairpin-helix domain-containing protein [Pseudomonadota bacterium]
MTRLDWFKAVFAAIILTIAPLSLAADAVESTSEQVIQLDINVADAVTIAAALDGVGLVKAREIVAYREMFGKFRSVDELIDVQGIGPATIEKNRHLILIVND